MIPNLLLVGLVAGAFVHDRTSFVRWAAIGAAASLLWGVAVGMTAGSTLTFLGGAAFGLANFLVGSAPSAGIRGVVSLSASARHHASRSQRPTFQPRRILRAPEEAVKLRHAGCKKVLLEVSEAEILAARPSNWRITRAGLAAEGSYTGGVGVPLDDLTESTFRAAYKGAGFTTDPTDYGPYAYDATNAVIAVLRSTLKGKQKLPTNVRALVVAGLQLTDRDGITGRVAFDSFGDARDPLFTLDRVQGTPLAWTSVSP